MPVEESEEQFLRPAQGTVRRHGRGGGRWLRSAVLCLFLAGAALLVFGGHNFLTSSKRLPIREVGITGAARAEADLLARIRPFLLGRNLLALDLAEIAGQVRAATPWVRYVALRRVFPDRVEIHVTEHDAIARDHNGSLLTRSGALLPEEPGLPADASLPRISGALSTAESRERLVAFLALLERAPASFANRVATIRIGGPDDLVVELTDRPYQIHLGASQFEERLNRYHNVEPLLSARYPALQTVDLRYRDRVVVAPVPTAVSGA